MDVKEQLNNFLSDLKEAERNNNDDKLTYIEMVTFLGLRNAMIKALLCVDDFEDEFEELVYSNCEELCQYIFEKYEFDFVMAIALHWYWENGPIVFKFGGFVPSQELLLEYFAIDIEEDEDLYEVISEEVYSYL